MNPPAHLRRLSLALLLPSLFGCAGLPSDPTPASVNPAASLATLPAPAPGAEPTAGLAPLAVELQPTAPAATAPAEPVVAASSLLKPTTEEEEAALRSDLWVRVRRGFAVPDLDNDIVRKWEQYYAGKPDYMKRMTERGGRYLYHIIEEVEKRGMPTELALLPFVESAFNPQAMSTARASGMWQFMPGTGRDFELRQNMFRDDRRNVLASTRAALDYLQQLHRSFGDWQHALAAYNWGQGNVSRAIARARQAGQDTAYATLPMPDETRNYVPKLQAIKNLVLNPQAFNLALPKIENHPYFLTVGIDRDIDVALAARLAGMSLDDFQQLNPQMNKPVILAAGTPHLVLPFDNAKHFARELARHRGPLATWTAWVAPRNVKPADAARLVGMDEAQLRDVNRIPPRMVVKAGSTLLVVRAAHTTRDVSERVADTAVIALAPEPVPGRRKLVKVGARGETVAALARRLRVAPAQLAHWNGVAPGASFRAGQSVVVMLAPAKGKAAARGVTRVAAKGSVGKPANRPAARTRVRVAQR